MRRRGIGRLRERWRQKRKRDLFARLRLKLTLKYSGMLMLMLLFFTLIVFGVIFLLVAQEQQRQVQAQVDAEVEQYQAILAQLPNVGQDASSIPASTTEAHGARFFTYIVTANGRLVTGDERMPEIRASLLNQLIGWVPSSGETRLATVRQPRLREEKKLLLSGRAVYNRGQIVGMLYTGNDVSFYWEVLLWLGRVLIGLVVMFSLLSLVVGQRMAARAMIPIKRSFQRQQQFVADASHELRTPLTVLKSSFDVIDLEDGDNLSEMSKRVLADMKDEVHSMSRLVADLLTLARSDSGAVELNVQEFDLVTVAEQLVRLRQVLAQEKGLRLELQAPESLPMTGDAERIKQLLAILVDNALKFTPSGGEINVTLDAERTHSGARRAEVIQVQDTGIGIPQEEQARIFERFYRVEEARTREAGGTGLGLAIAKWIAEAHQGTLQVQSQLGQGSTFTVRIPKRK